MTEHPLPSSDDSSSGDPSSSDPSSDHGEFPLSVLEDDETVPPRPEEELADVARSAPDPHS